MKEERDKKEQDEYDQWKDGFVVDDQGEETTNFSEENLINDFINYIKLRKVVALEDLSGEFKISNNVRNKSLM